MRRNTFWIVLVAVVLAAATSCAQKPSEDVAAATQALDQARAEHADEYAPEAWAAAQDADARLRVELDAQDNKFTLFRSYSSAKQLAAEVKEKAEKAQQDAMVAKGQMKEEATRLIADARQKAGEVKQALARAPSGKGTQADLAAMRTDTESVESSLAEAESALNAGDYRTAKTKAESAIQMLERIKSELMGAEQAKQRARGV